MYLVHVNLVSEILGTWDENSAIKPAMLKLAKMQLKNGTPRSLEVR